MNKLNELRINPADYVNSLNSPIGVYLRREMLRKESKADATLKKVTYQKTVAEQSADGSWDQLFVKTANNLWDHALLGYNAQDSSVQKGLEWLLSIQKHSYHGYPGFFCSSNRKDPSIMRSTLYGEFGPGCTIFYQTTYATHLLHVFGFWDKALPSHPLVFILLRFRRALLFFWVWFSSDCEASSLWGVSSLKYRARASSSIRKSLRTFGRTCRAHWIPVGLCFLWFPSSQ